MSTFTYTRAHRVLSCLTVVFLLACSDDETSSPAGGTDAGSDAASGDTGAGDQGTVDQGEGPVTAYDGNYAVTLTRESGETADACITIANGAFSTNGVNSEGEPFTATGSVTADGDFIVNAQLADTIDVGIVASVDSNGVITGTYSLSMDGSVIGTGRIDGNRVDECPPLPLPPEQANLSDHYGVEVRIPLDASTTFTITTYNLGLAPTFVPLLAERLQPNLEALAAYDADVLCLQEVWLPPHRTAVETAIATNFPHTYWVEPQQRFTEEAPCTEEEVAPLVACLNDSCGELEGDAFTQCAIDNCAVVLFQISEQNEACGAAILAQVGTDDIAAAIAALLQPTPVFAFEGSNGLMIASRHELSDTQIEDFIDISTTNRRSALFATVDVGGADQHIGCTHLTANLAPNIPYTGSFDSWEEEGNAQAQAMVDFAANYAGSDGATYLAGDFNCSIENAETGVIADFEGNCQIILDAGYESAAMEQLGCSFCDANLLNTGQAGGGGEGDKLLDHVFTRNTADVADIEAELVFDEPFDLPDDEDM